MSVQGVSVQGGCLPGGCLRRGVQHPLWTKFFKHACENITFQQLLLWIAIKQKSLRIHTDICRHDKTELTTSTPSMIPSEPGKPGATRNELGLPYF